MKSKLLKAGDIQDLSQHNVSFVKKNKSILEMGDLLPIHKTNFQELRAQNN